MASLNFAERLLVLNFYGTLSAVGAALSLGAAALLASTRQPVFALPPFLLACAASWIAWRVGRRLPRKARMAERVLRAIRRSGFRDELFRGMCADPCMRMTTRYILRKTGYRQHSKRLITRFRASHVYLFENGASLSELVSTDAVSESAVAAAVLAAVNVDTRSVAVPRAVWICKHSS